MYTHICITIYKQYIGFLWEYVGRMMGNIMAWWLITCFFLFPGDIMGILWDIWLLSLNLNMVWVYHGGMFHRLYDLVCTPMQLHSWKKGNFLGKMMTTKCWGFIPMDGMEKAYFQANPKAILLVISHICQYRPIIYSHLSSFIGLKNRLQGPSRFYGKKQ